MADNIDPNIERQKYVNDPRIACKYGTKCYQKNDIHQQKYKHPPPRRADKVIHPRKKFKMDVKGDEAEIKPPVQPNVPDSSDDEKNKMDDRNQLENDTDSLEPKISETQEVNEDVEVTHNKTLDLGRTPKDFDPKDFIKEKFLVEMSEDFYNFWDFCKVLNKKCPQEAFKVIGLTLVGPYDVLAERFHDIPEQPNKNYLIHWRYFYDPPEFQTVIKGDEKTGFHIGYFRDSAKEMPVYLASNAAETDGIFKIMGDNIFAAVYLYLEDVKKTGDPFKRMHVGRFQSAVKKKAEELNLNLLQSTPKTRDRDKKIVTRSFSKMGIVVPYNRKTQVGYRDLGVSNKSLMKLLDDIEKASPEQKKTFLSKLQDILTNVSIATDECDFGTGIELGLDILAHGIDSLNQTASRFLATNYRLIGREEFAKIVEAHMENRKKGSNLSII